MKKRSVEILQRLLKFPHRGLDLQKLLSDYHITEKTLRGDIQEIIDFADASSVFADSHVLRLQKGADLQALNKRLEAMDLYDYKMSLAERKYYISAELLRHSDYISMQQLADDMYVTRNTVVNDCKMVGKFLREYQITFVSRSKLGIKAVATAAQRQNLLIGIFSQSLLPLQDSEPFFARFLAKKMGFAYPFSDITRHMLSYAHEHGLFFAKETAGLLAVNAFVLLNDRRGAAAADSPQALDSVGCMLDYAARQLNCPVGRGEIAAMEKVIFQRDLRPQIQSINDFELYGVISHFVFRVGQAVGTDIQHDDLLVKSLLLHMKNVKNWGETFEFELDGCFPNIALVQKSVAENCCILENYLHYKMNQNMRDGIVVHICAAICRCQTTMRPSRVIISCPGSMATSKYLEAQVRSYFNLQIEGVTESRKLENCAVDLSGIDFVISTVQIRSCPVPVAVVSPVLTLEDINLIQTLSFRRDAPQKSTSLADYPLLARLQEVYATGDSKKIAWLDRELNRLLSEVHMMESETARTSALLQMLQTRYIKLTAETLEWRQAMKLAAEDLIRDGFFGVSYVEKAIENVEEYGSYIIVNQGIALAHANRDAGVYRDGLGLLVSRDGICFEDGEIVYMLFFFSTKEDADYLQLFKEIIKLGNTSENLQKMRRVDSPEQAYRLMMEILTDYQSPDERGSP